jgi:hypothetical protein
LQTIRVVPVEIGEPRTERKPTTSECLWEHVFVTAQGSAWPRLRRALDHGNLVEALSAASELDNVGLDEALEIVLLLADQDSPKFRRAALRWHSRFCQDIRGVEPGEALAVLALLGLLSSGRAKPAARALAELVYRRGAERSAEALVRWAQT